MASLHSVGTLHLACCIGRTEESRQTVYTPGMLPVVSNDWGTHFSMGIDVTLVVLLVPWSCNEWFSMGNDVTLGTLWSCNVLPWSWNVLF